MLQDGESEVIFSLEDDIIQSEFSTFAIEESRTDQVAVSHPPPIIVSQENASVSESANVNQQATVEISIEVPSLSKIIYEGSGIEEGASSPLEELLEELELEESESESDILSKYGFIPDGYLEKKKRRSVHPSSANVDPLEVESCICSEDSDVLKQSADSGIIDISFPENPDSELIEKYCLPPSYYTLTGKERLLLLFAENFRRQFQFLYPHRRPLVLAVRNECDVQKFVSTTLRPTGFIIPEFIGSLEEITKFVADFIIYEPLENPISLPPRLMSPDMLLRIRQGNSFEMATLLCSMLIGAGFPAVVVSGIARRETTRNDQREVECPFKPADDHSYDDDDEDVEVDTSKYTLREPPDLTSHLQEELDRIAAEREKEENRLREERERSQMELLEMQSDDRYHGRRTHAWVALIENAPWSVKPRQKRLNDEGEEIIDPPKAFFIEPSTGFRHEVNSRNYIRIDSIWHHYNYYINLQECYIKEIKWDLDNSNHWGHFLPGEPPEMRVEEEVSEEGLEDRDDDIWLEKHLDMIPSWVQQLHISLQDFDQRFPNLRKVVHYKRAIHERCSPYSKRDGKVIQLTQFEDDVYAIPIIRWEYYANRRDLLEKIKIDFVEKQIEESFKPGRPDKLKFYEHSAYTEKPRYLHFYHFSRLDSLKLLELHENKTILHFKKRHDFCFYLEFASSSPVKGLEHIIDKLSRNDALPANKDIAMRHFHLKEKKIYLTFHYAKGAVTASTREFIKPPKPDYGQEVIFDPTCTKGYNANPLDPDPTEVELYFLLLKQIKEENRLKREYSNRVEEINRILMTRKDEMKNPLLQFSIFDPLRNQAARKIRMKEIEDEKKRKRQIAMNDADFLAPYLVLYEDEEPNYEQSWAAYNACLDELKTRYVHLLNKLQRKYEDLTAEAKALKRFLDKFHDQFDDFDYERLLREKKDIELNKRMVQQRLNLTHEEGQQKYEKVKESLLSDSRLNLTKE